MQPEQNHQQPVPDMEPRWEHTHHEQQISALWEQSGYYNPDVCIRDGICAPDAEPFCMVLPPPNVTGVLHIGHAAGLAIEDIMIRYARMNGKRTLWIPGTDSAAIATQSKVETEMYKKEGLTRSDVGRTEMIRRINAFVEQSKDTIISQTKAMGSSLDWSRYAYTLDDSRLRAVYTAFVRMYEAGLIYRGDRIVNWDPKLQTTVSDDEIEYKEQKDPFYYLAYGPFVIGTVRPETKFGDKYVVVHPDDPRYRQYSHGQTLNVEWINGPIVATIIKDSAIDMTMGTGAMTITPAHSQIDFEIAQRHHLSFDQIIDDTGILLPIAGEFAGMHIKKARPAIIEKLTAKGLVVKTDETYIHNIATNSRGGGVIEPQIKRQWFVNVNQEFIIAHSEIPGISSGSSTTLKKLMRAAVASGAVRITPDSFDKTYFHWIDNLRDWCISRQIWFGHRVPVWYRGSEMIVSVTPPTGDGWEQDPDTLDTWFSSGLWTFSTLGWPDATNDLSTYHPTRVLETGYDILFFWIARMILMSGFLLGTVPFRSVYLHGLVRDGQGRKMSKSLGNIIDPLILIEQYGTDATRMSLIIGAAAGTDIKLSPDKVRGYRNFATKIWNAARFVLLRKPAGYNREAVVLSPDDSAVIEQARLLRTRVGEHIEQFQFHLAAETAYHYFWHTFADVVIENAKPRLSGSDGDDSCRAYRMLEDTLEILLITLHPFVPFVTEAVYQKLRPGSLLMVASWKS